MVCPKCTAEDEIFTCYPLASIPLLFVQQCLPLKYNNCLFLLLKMMSYSTAYFSHYFTKIARPYRLGDRKVISSASSASSAPLK